MLLSELDLNLQKFVPVLSVLTGHSQTVLGHLIPSITKSITYAEEILTLKDGDELFLEYCNQKSKVTLSLYHGLAGDSTADYIRRSADIAYNLGWNVVLVNHRRAHPKAKASKTYHSGRGEDASDVLEWSKAKFKSSLQVALGFSMSGSILLNLISNRYGSVLPDYAIVVNAPLNLEKAAHKLTQGFSKIYDFRFFLILKRIIKQNEDGIKLPFIGKTIDIDEAYTSKVNGFKDAQDYYTQCSSFKYLANIKTKTFVLSSYDDPFIDVVDYENADWNSNVHLTLEKFGGHMGYVDRHKNPHYGHRWLDHYLERVFAKIIEIEKK